MAFDIEGARAAGYTDDEIKAYMGEQKGISLSDAFVSAS